MPCLTEFWPLTAHANTTACMSVHTFTLPITCYAEKINCGKPQHKLHDKCNTNRVKHKMYTNNWPAWIKWTAGISVLASPWVQKMITDHEHWSVSPRIRSRMTGIKNNKNVNSNQSALKIWLSEIKQIHYNGHVSLESFCSDRIQWNFLRQTAVSGCEGFLTFWEPTLSPSSHPEDGDRASYRNIRKPSHPDTAVCPKKNHSVIVMFIRTIKNNHLYLTLRKSANADLRLDSIFARSMATEKLLMKPL